MTLADRKPYTNLTPANGVPTDANRMLDNSGESVPSSDEINKYIRVLGSNITRLEPRFWGEEGNAIVRIDGRGQDDVYLVTRSVMRIEIEVQKVDPAISRKNREQNFASQTGMAKIRSHDGSPVPWQSVPENCARQKYLMFLCQEHPDTLRKVGFSAADIARCSFGGELRGPTDASGKPLLDGNGRPLKFHVHHRVPLQAGGSNGIDNLCLVGSDVHGPFFHSGDDPRLNRMAAGEVRKIALTVPRPDIHVIAVGLNIHQHHYTPPDEKGRAA